MTKPTATKPTPTASAQAEKTADPAKSGFGPLAAVVVTVAIYFASQFFGALILLAVAWSRGWTQPEINQWVQRTIPQFIYIVLVEGASVWLLWRFLKRRRLHFKDIGWRRSVTSRDFKYVIVGAAIYFPLLIAAMAFVQDHLHQINLNQPQQIGFDHAHGLLLIPAFISLVVLPPLTEELLVRGFLYTGLKQKLPKLAATVLASLLFAAAHLEFGSGAKLLWSAAIDTFILSMVLVYLREKTGSLWASIGLHMTKNCLAFAALFIFVK